MYCPIDWFVLIANNIYNNFKPGDEYSVRFGPSLGENIDPSLAVKFFQVVFPDNNCFSFDYP